jgi:predicted permease
MIELLKVILPYTKGLWTLPWILIGFLITILLSKLFKEEKINIIMKKTGLILLYVFVPLLLFKILSSVNFQKNEISFSLTCFIILIFMYIIAYLFAQYKVKKNVIKGESKSHYIKTVLTNQGRSSAFVGGFMLAIDEWRILATIYMIISAIFLFSIIPAILSYFNKKELDNSEKSTKIHALPWYLKVFPWYLLCFAFIAILIHNFTDIDIKYLGDLSVIFDFITAITIPAALYYVGAGIHIRDIKNMFNILRNSDIEKKNHQNLIWSKDILLLTVFITFILTLIIFGFLCLLNIISKEWFAVIIINSILPITSTNMFLVPYGINKKVTALTVSWTTIFCVPIVIFLIILFKSYMI